MLAHNPTQEADVYAYLVEHGPLTRQQIAEGMTAQKQSENPRACAVLLQSVCARVRPMMKDGRVKTVGEVMGKYGRRNYLIRAIKGEKQNPQTDLFA